LTSLVNPRNWFAEAIATYALVFFGPVITVFIQSESYYKITHLLEERQNVEFLMLEIERIESDNKKKES